MLGVDPITHLSADRFDREIRIAAAQAAQRMDEEG